MSNKLTPSYHGYVGSTKDALLIIQSIINKQLNLIPRRPHERERAELIQSGNVFIFVEEHSGIKRWTDGISWSPSRILGRFLVYRELDKANLNNDDDPKKSKKKRKLSLSTEDIEMTTSTSHSHQHGFKDQGLIKKTLSINTNARELNLLNKDERQTIHLISYYNANDVLNGKLLRPSELDLKHVPINNYLWNAIKESNLGGKIPIEDEAYYFLDNNYQLQNMSLLNNQAARLQHPHQQSHHQRPMSSSHHLSHQMPGQYSMNSAMVANGSGSTSGNNTTNSSNSSASSNTATTNNPTPSNMVYNKSNFMLPLPSNYDYYNVNLNQKYDTNEDISFINPFTSNTTNFNLSSNLNTFYHDQFQVPQPQQSQQPQQPQQPQQQQPTHNHNQLQLQPQQVPSAQHSNSLSSAPSQSSSISTMGSVSNANTSHHQQHLQYYPFPQYFHQDLPTNKKFKWNEEVHPSHLHPIEDHGYIAYNT